MQEDESDDEDEDGDEEMELSRMAEEGKNVAEEVQVNV